MTKTNLSRLAVFLIIAILVINLVVFALKLISAILFWVIIAVFGIIAYKWTKKKI